jgi:hypothetical protein
MATGSRHQHRSRPHGEAAGQVAYARRYQTRDLAVHLRDEQVHLGRARLLAQLRGQQRQGQLGEHPCHHPPSSRRKFHCIYFLRNGTP